MDSNMSTMAVDALAERVEGMILARSNGAVRNLKVIPLSGEVVLTGTSSSYYGKQLAIQAALDACGSLLVTNDIEVR
ncbi:MAG: BON domain-containing protein [Planctomycetota bacterium]|nr:BON domain-containing protein [Planctomycetota bacterium]